MILKGVWRLLKGVWSVLDNYDNEDVGDNYEEDVDEEYDDDDEDVDDARICWRFPGGTAAVGGSTQGDTWTTMQCNAMQCNVR